MNDDQNPATPPTGWQYRPGDAVTPTVQTTPAPAAQPQPPAVAATPQAAEPASAQPVTPVAEQPDVPPAPAPEAPDASDQSADGAEDYYDAPDEPIEWTASEYVAHQKTTKWYAMLMLAALAGALLAYVLTKDVISAVSIVLLALVFAFAAARKPRVLTYRLDASGITIGEKVYSYGQFRSFAVADEGPFSSIALAPLKRFMPVLSIYYEPADEERIVQMLADRLPLEAHRRDAIDSLLHKIRF